MRLDVADLDRGGYASVYGREPSHWKAVRGAGGEELYTIRVEHGQAEDVVRCRFQVSCGGTAEVRIADVPGLDVAVLEMHLAALHHLYQSLVPAVPAGGLGRDERLAGQHRAEAGPCPRCGATTSDHPRGR